MPESYQNAVRCAIHLYGLIADHLTLPACAAIPRSSRRRPPRGRTLITCSRVSLAYRRVGWSQRSVAQGKRRQHLRGANPQVRKRTIGCTTCQRPRLQHTRSPCGRGGTDHLSSVPIGRAIFRPTPGKNLIVALGKSTGYAQKGVRYLSFAGILGDSGVDDEGGNRNKKSLKSLRFQALLLGGPIGIRTRVSALRGPRPRPG